MPFRSFRAVSNVIVATDPPETVFRPAEPVWVPSVIVIACVVAL